MPVYHFQACLFYGVPLNQAELLQLMKRYPQFPDWEADKDQPEDWYSDIRDLRKEIDQEHLGVTLRSFYPELEDKEPTHFLAISDTYERLGPPHTFGVVEVGDFEDWNKRLKVTCEAYGIKWGTAPQYYLFKDVACPTFQVVIGYGIEVSYGEMRRVVTANLGKLSEHQIDYLDELCEQVEKIWTAKLDPVQIVHIDRGDENWYFLMIRDTYQAHELDARPKIQPPQRELWDAFLKAKSIGYEIEWNPPRYYIVLSLPRDYL